MQLVVGLNSQDRLYAGINVSDRPDDWTKNFRCPDVAVYLSGNPAYLKGASYIGGPDFAVEVTSPDEDPYRNLKFYHDVATRELLIVDRDPWRLELFRRDAESMHLVGRSTSRDSAVLESDVLPVNFRLIDAPTRPQIEIARRDNTERWVI